jgi:hypothetical protein
VNCHARAVPAESRDAAKRSAATARAVEDIVADFVTRTAVVTTTAGVYVNSTLVAVLG